MREKPVPICYRGRPVGEGRVDLAWKDVYVEVKTSDNLVEVSSPKWRAQLRKYLNQSESRGKSGIIVVFHRGDRPFVEPVAGWKKD